MTAPPDASFSVSDDKLVHQACHGDAAAMHALVDRYAPRLYRSARHLAGNDADAQDLVQETLLGMLRGIDRFDGRSAFSTWLWAILIRQAARQRREASRALPHRAGPPNSPANSPAVPQAAWTGPVKSASSGASGGAGEKSDARLDVHAAIARLKDEHREVLLLRQIEGFSYAQIAATLRLPQGTVESRLHRARQELKQYLTAYAPNAKEPYSN